MLSQAPSPSPPTRQAMLSLGLSTREPMLLLEFSPSARQPMLSPTPFAREPMLSQGFSPSTRQPMLSPTLSAREPMLTQGFSPFARHAMLSPAPSTREPMLMQNSSPATRQPMLSPAPFTREPTLAQELMPSARQLILSRSPSSIARQAMLPETPSSSSINSYEFLSLIAAMLTDDFGISSSRSPMLSPALLPLSQVCLATPTLPPRFPHLQGLMQNSPLHCHVFMAGRSEAPMHNSSDRTPQAPGGSSARVAMEL
ncbi:hypothetical protein SCP_0301060 [Sparassis crispa]|uniref:Uncharacterized protein n=1 Tax=Sparassis crispa TaxID=139825 RepID=A0A401GE30_9APHY|nr:hypothetical protein SCP_0301060 [Sparassis crispa]GBE80391.1 hypothetical protein SCP_0301060 [Sparassis crispa]